jgi:hypothetical protein
VLAVPLRCAAPALRRLPPTPSAPPLLTCLLVQDEIHKRYKHGSALQMMCWMNFW